MTNPLTKLLLQKLLLTEGLSRDEAISLWLHLRHEGRQEEAENLVRQINMRSAHKLWPASPERSEGGENL